MQKLDLNSDDGQSTLFNTISDFAEYYRTLLRREELRSTHPGDTEEAKKERRQKAPYMKRDHRKDVELATLSPVTDEDAAHAMAMHGLKNSLEANPIIPHTESPTKPTTLKNRLIDFAKKLRFFRRNK